VLPFDDENAGLYSVGQVADMLGVQQAFLRRLDSFDVVSPERSEGRQRRYSRNDVRLVQHSMSLIDDGITLSGVRRILGLEQQVRALRDEVARLKGELKGRPSGAKGD